jgi:hypothetical protein
MEKNRGYQYDFSASDRAAVLFDQTGRDLYKNVSHGISFGQSVAQASEILKDHGNQNE